MNKKISLTLVAALCVSLACMSFYSLSGFSTVRKTTSVKAISEEETILAYVKKNNLKAQKTASGLYYVIDAQGTGEKVTAGKSLSVNYTGHTLDGNMFDSNVDPAAGHVQPFTFTIGGHQVITGWDEGLQLFNVGGKGKLIIPSALAYGPNSPSPKIPANSILEFDVEVVAQK